MKKRILILLTLFVTEAALANNAIPTGAVYYTGEQADFSGGVDECYVEADYSSDGMNVKIRSLIIDTHEAELAGAGPVEAIYSAAPDFSYIYAGADDETVLSLELKAVQTKKGETLNLFLSDGGHVDSYVCKNLVEADDSKLSDLQSMFADFESYVEEHDEVAGYDNHNHHHHHHAHD